MTIRIKVTAARGQEATLEHAGPQINIGRDPACELPLRDGGESSVSWRHARIELTSDGIFLRDMESTNGTYLNDRRIQGRVHVKEGDFLRLGKEGPYLQILEGIASERAPKAPPSPIQTHAFSSKNIDFVGKAMAPDGSRAAAAKTPSNSNSERAIDEVRQSSPPTQQESPSSVRSVPFVPNGVNRRLYSLWISIRRSSRRAWGFMAGGALIAFIGIFLVSKGGVNQPPAIVDIELAKDGYRFLKTYCSSCHSTTDPEALPDVLDRNQLTAAGLKAYLIPGDPEHSLLWKTVESGRMPKNKKSRPVPVPTEKEKLRFKDWILAGAVFPPDLGSDGRTHKDILERIHAHLSGIPLVERKYQRYFTMVHLSENKKSDAKTLRLHRGAFSKLVNSLSWKEALVLPKAIDPQQTIYHLDLRDVEWDGHGIWTSVTQAYPYGLTHFDFGEHSFRKLAREVYKDTGTLIPYVRLDWFIARASQPPLYETLLRLPVTRRGDDVQELERKLGVNFVENFLKAQLQRSGFGKSLVSKQNRLIERHETKDRGYYWKSYDFKQTDDERGNLNRFPLGPIFPGNPFQARAFRHDGGEMIFSLPNRLQGYFLADAQGRFIPKGPADIVFDDQEIAGSVEIVNGLSCINCHQEGIKRRDDTIRADRTVDRKTLVEVEQRHPTKEAMNVLFAADQASFQTAAAKVTKDYLQDGDEDKECIGVCAKLYLHGLDATGINADELAHELHLENGRMLKQKIEANPRLRIDFGLGPLLREGSIRRTTLEGASGGFSVFQGIARELELGDPTRGP